MAPLSEREIKQAVVDHLFRKNTLKCGVIINELPVANWSRRADLAVANGKLQAFEIKSDLDSLRRLDGQIALFATRFDKVVLVTTSRFLTRALNRLPPYVEIWEASRGRDGIDLRIARRGHMREIKSHHILASYLQKSELRSLVKSAGIDTAPDISRDELETIVNRLPLNRLRKFVLDRLKQRYKREQQAPLLTRSERAGLLAQGVIGVIQSSDVRLTRPSGAHHSERNARLVAFELRHGPLPDDMPKAIRVRRKPSITRNRRLDQLRQEH